MPADQRFPCAIRGIETSGDPRDPGTVSIDEDGRPAIIGLGRDGIYDEVTLLGDSESDTHDSEPLPLKNASAGGG